MKHPNRHLLLAKALLLAALAAITQVQAQTWTWTNPAGGNFSAAANWDLHSLPGSAVDTALTAGARTPDLGGTASTSEVTRAVVEALQARPPVGAIA